MPVYLTELNSFSARVESVPAGRESAAPLRRPDIRIIILTFFFLSGATGLIYEVVWNRMLMLVFGATVFAVATVLTAFMAGMALGSFYFGRFIDRRGEGRSQGSPLRVYAYLEAGIGVFALLLPFILVGVEAIYVAIHRSLYTSFYILSFVKFLFCFAVLIIPTTLMGGTLPVISKFFTSPSMNRLGWNIGLLYAVNTFGAVLGCFSAGFILIRAIGVSGTIYLASAVNIVITLGILLLSRGEKGSPAYNGQAETPVPPEGAGKMLALPGWAGQLALWVIAVSGFCALAYEVLWTRVLTLFLGSTTYAFTTMLSAFLCGIALGSVLLARFIDARKDLLTILGAAQIGIALLAVLLIPVFGKLYSIGVTFTRPGWWTFIVSRFALSFLVMLIPTMLMGASFPLVSKIYARSFRDLGRSIGDVYSVNTLGSILGSFLAGFILIPRIGVQRSIMIVAFLNVAAGAMVMVMGIVYFASRAGTSRNTFRASLLGVSIIVIAVASTLVDVGQPLTRFTAVFKGPGEENELLFYKEGVDASVTVVEDPQGVRRAFVDANQAAEDSRWDLPSHSIIGHLPILLHPDPKTALVIGFGMGVTSWSISRHGVQVDAIEISPGIVEANKYFPKINHNVLDDPLVNLIVDDGRNYALTTDKRYDMISTGIIHPLVSANSAAFYTTDFYELCKKILTPPSIPPASGGENGREIPASGGENRGGIMCQWVPLHRLPEEHYKMIIRTFKAVFPHTTLWYKYTPDFSILIGTPERLRIDYLNFKRRIEKESVKADLEAVNMADPLALLDSFMMDEDTIDQYVGPGPLHTDKRPRMEFFGPQASWTTYPNLLGMIKFRKSVLPLLTNIGVNNDMKDKLQQYFRATQYTIAGQLFYVKGEFENSIRQYRMASSMNPQDSNIRWLADHVQQLMDEEDIEEYRQIVRMWPDSATAHAGLGLLYQRRGMMDEAIAEMKAAIQLDPGLVVARINLSAMYQKKGMIDEAIEQLRNLVGMQSGSAVIHGRLGDLYREKGDFSQAEAEFRKALELDPDMALAHHSLAILYLQQASRGGFQARSLLDDALASARKAVQLSDQAKFIATLARVYYEKMMYTEAEKEINRAISIEPDNESYRALLAQIQKNR